MEDGVYADGLIREILSTMDPKVEPIWVENFMRTEYGTLDHLPRSRFVQEAQMVVSALRSGETTYSELADMFGR